MKTHFISFGVATILSAMIAAPASAAVVTFTLDDAFSGTAPSGNLLATFDDGGTAGTVTLTMDATSLSGDEFVSEWYFNFSGAGATALTFDHVSGETAVTVNYSADSFRADGDGIYDILFSFEVSESGDDRFAAGETSVYTISGDGITAEMFAVLAAPGGGHGPFYTAAHVQGVGPDGQLSGWLGAGDFDEPPPEVPEPASLLLLGSGLLGLAAATRRRRV